MTEISVVAWNLHQAVDRRPEKMARTRQYLATTLRPTVALVQDAHIVPGAPGGHVALRAAPGYSSAVVGYEATVEPVPDIVTRYSPRHRFPVSPSVPGTFAAAQLVDPSGGIPFVAISLYGLMAPVYAQVAILRAVADLIPLFDSQLRKRIVIRGDINLFDQSADRVERARWEAILPVIDRSVWSIS